MVWCWCYVMGIFTCLRSIGCYLGWRVVRLVQRSGSLPDGGGPPGGCGRQWVGGLGGCVGLEGGVVVIVGVVVVGVV